MTSPDIEAALRREREEIARMLRNEAAEHIAAAADLRAYEEGDDEADLHEHDADLINRLADLILARTPVVAEPEAPEIAF